MLLAENVHRRIACELIGGEAQASLFYYAYTDLSVYQSRVA